MPMTLVDRLPLPNLKVYTAGSVLVLSVAVYHAISATSEPGWRGRVAMAGADAASADAAGEGKMVPALAALDVTDGTRAFAEHLADVLAYMMQEPLCMWALINVCYCGLAVVGLALQRLVFGPLRVAEAQRVRDKLWNYVFYKFIFVFGVLNVQYMDEVLLWWCWFTILGFLHLLGQLCKDRFEYLSSSPSVSSGAHARLAALVWGVVCAGTALLARAPHWGLPGGRDTLAFMAAECILVVVSALHVAARYVLAARGADAAGPAAYYTHLAFDAFSLVVELMHVIHMVVFSNLVVSMPSLVLLMQMRHLLHELQARLRKHRLYTALAQHMSRNYPMASKEEVDKNQDNCAICWEPMKEARKLPCSHLFHNSCLCQWVQQDASCPTCRRALHAPAPPRAAPTAPALRLPLAPPPPGATPAARPNHLFHFDGSRYVSWLPSFSVEVTRVRAAGPHALPASLSPRIELMAQQVQQMFPGYPLPLLAADLALTRSPDLTVGNILEGRLPPPPPLAPEAATPSDAAPAPAAEPSSAAISAPEVVVRRTATAPSLDASTSTADGHAHSTAAPAPHAPSYDLQHEAHSSSQFSKSASERESLLQQRKEMLIESARKKYQDKLAAGGGGGASPLRDHPAHS